MALINTHLTMLKEYIDELIVNSGMIKVQNPERVVEKVKVDFLVKLAFRFYSKLYNSEKFAGYLHDIFDKLDKDNNSKYDVFQAILDEMKDNDDFANLQCLNCNAPISKEELIKSGENMPLCEKCKDHIGQEIDIWEKIFGG
ncbi:MAG TPA: hypothetical protein PL063_03420 [Candidatus Cloacimonadota bacterium]|nr:hypothetical protein [Candidatus Cloacimonadales bacterium]HPY96242.1 hypothetical protein [Candidatus Cloacimonadota bacterium]HQB40831.1 hypothetical protein [Candidatus Cloacimonadota bacterium]